MKFIITLIFIFLIPGSLKTFYDGARFIFGIQIIWQYLLLGFAFGTLIYYIIIRRNDFFSTFEHELTHAIVALFFFRKIDTFTATLGRGGYITHYGGFGGEFADVLIGLAPYYLPTFTFISVLFAPIIPTELYPWFIAWIGFTLAYHTFSTAKETADNWDRRTFKLLTGQAVKTDIGKAGYILSFFAIVCLNAIFHGLIFWILSKGLKSIIDWAVTTVSVSFNFYIPIALFIYNAIADLFKMIADNLKR